MSIKKILWALGAVVLVGAGGFLYTPPYQPPRDYPPLPDAERQRMDLKLFNELSVNGSWPPLHTNEIRQQLILNMAKQGFEVADLAYMLLDVKYGMSGRTLLMPNERSAYQHLRTLADLGDPSAQCLAALVISRWNLNKQDYERYVVSAAKAGQPYCTNILSGLLRINIGPHGPLEPPYWQTIPKDDSKGRELELLAAKWGVQRAQLYLMHAYGGGDYGYLLDIGKAKCWLSLAEKADTGATINEKPYLLMLIDIAQRKGYSTDFSDYSPESWCEKATQK